MRSLRVLSASTLLAVLLAAPAASAQTRLPPQANRPPADEGIGVGVLGGWTNSTVKGSAEDEAALKARNDYMFGAWVGGNRNGRVGFLGEANYVTKGTREKEFGGALRLTYLEIPALVRVNIGARTREGARFYALAGPAFAFKLKATLEDPELPDLDVSPDYETFDVGLLLGAGGEVKRIGVEFRVNWGLMQIYEPLPDEQAVKNFQFQVVGKFRFN